MDFNITDEERTKAIDRCRSNLGGPWKDAKDSEISVAKLRGGLSNLLYRCKILPTTNETPKEHELVSGDRNQGTIDVLLRLYGPAYSETETQLEIFKKLANEQLGPKLYGQFDEGRLEEYLPSSALTWEQMTSVDTSAVIAKKIACIHKLDLSNRLKQNRNWLLEQFKDNYDYVVALQKREPLFQDLPVSTRRIALELVFETDFQTQIEYMRKILHKLQDKLVFSHNDLHQNNILMLNDTVVHHNEKSNNKDAKTAQKFQNDKARLVMNNNDDSIVLIDFEFCSYNYRAFDMANHLSEWCFDYSGDEYPNFKFNKERFPSEDRQRGFLKHYANQVVLSAKSNGESVGNGHENEVNHLIESLFKEMRPLFMASNMLWSLWAIKSACTSNIKFGYWEMAKAKWEIYLLCKSRYESLRPNL